MTESDIDSLVQMHAVYRMFSASGQLLYVGMTGDLGRRLDGHAEKRWFPKVTSIALEWFPSEDAARIAERDAIRSEHPVHNIAGIPGRRRRPPSKGILPGATQATLLEAVAAGILGSSIDAARRASTRPGFPAPVGQTGLARLYDLEELRAWNARRWKAS